MAKYSPKHSDWYCGSRWKRRRTLQLRIEPLCRMCRDAGRAEPARVADHVTPHGGDWNKFVLGELQSLCFDCHDRRKRLVELRGFDSAVGEDGWPLDPAHPTNVRARKSSQM
jgi:5-methylcytosine-specific restriction endonuclease McrA